MCTLFINEVRDKTGINIVKPGAWNEGANSCLPCMELVAVAMKGGGLVLTQSVSARKMLVGSVIRTAEGGEATVGGI